MAICLGDLPLVNSPGSFLPISKSKAEPELQQDILLHVTVSGEVGKLNAPKGRAGLFEHKTAAAPNQTCL
jgi:hypothetical protein